MALLETVIVTLALVHLGIVFTVAGTLKLVEREAFGESLRLHGLLSPVGIRAAGRGLPPFEILLGAWLLSGAASRAAVLVAVSVFGIFLIYRAGVYRVRRSDIPCGCYGAARAAASVGAAAEVSSLIVNAGVALAVFAVAPDRSFLYGGRAALTVVVLVFVALCSALGWRRHRVRSVAGTNQGAVPWIPETQLLAKNGL
jgi:hypothetical protein